MLDNEDEEKLHRRKLPGNGGLACRQYMEKPGLVRLCQTGGDGFTRRWQERQTEGALKIKKYQPATVADGRNRWLYSLHGMGHTVK